MMHVILDPTKLTKYHELTTKVELSLTKAKLFLLKNRRVDAFDFITKADIDMAYLSLFIMICEKSCTATSEGAMELVNKGIVKDIEVIKN